MSRWSSLPISEQEQKYLASTTTTTASTIVTPLRRGLGGLLRQEISDSGQTICYYRAIGADSTIPYLCELGCCHHGCCSAHDLAARSTHFGWAIGLLAILILIILVGLIGIVAVWIINKQKDRIHKQHLSESSTDTASVSQISGPTTFYPYDSYYQPHVTNIKPYL